jgi:hypothetical protein
MNLRRVNYWWAIPLISLFLVMQPIGVAGESDTGSIIAAEGITVSVDFGNGTTLEFDDLNGSTVLDVTSEVLDVQVQWYGPLVYIRGIEGIVAAGQSGWEYWVNGEFASIAVNLYTLADGDTIEWVYTTQSTQTQSPHDSSLVPGIILVAVSGFGFISIVYFQTSRKLKQ